MISLLRNLPPDTDFEIPELRLTGNLVRCNECSASVRYGNNAEVIRIAPGTRVVVTRMGERIIPKEPEAPRVLPKKLPPVVSTPAEPVVSLGGKTERTTAQKTSGEKVVRPEVKIRPVQAQVKKPSKPEPKPKRRNPWV